MDYLPIYNAGSFITLLSQPLSFALRILKRQPASDKLTIRDSRTQRQYDVPIDHESIPAIYLQAFGLKVLDPGFSNTAVMKSRITFVDGERGKIHYRQMPIEELFNNHDWEEVAYLLIWGSLPTNEQKSTFRSALAANMVPPPQVVEAIRRLPPDTPLVSLALAGLAAYIACDRESVPTTAANSTLYLHSTENVDKAIVHTIASIAVILGTIYCHQQGKEMTPVDPKGSFISNVLLMMGFVKAGDESPDPKVVRSVERLWILFADHEMTNSTAAFLHVASTLADPLSCCAAYVASGYGPLHAGAIDLAYKEFERIGCIENVPGLINDVKAKKYRLFGYGHRIYKTVDPRANLIHTIMKEVRAESKDPLLAIAEEIDRVAATDSYFTSRNLKANADLYGCFVYTALGFETNIISGMAMLSRIPGVMAHWREIMSQPPRLWRPQQVYIDSK